MSHSFWWSLLVLALGTLLLRAAPLAWMLRYLAQADEALGQRSPPEWLAVLGTNLLAAMLGVFMVPAEQTIIAWAAVALGLVVTYVVWRLTRSLAWPVIAGVTAVGLVLLLQSFI